jgi:hypothetical protein
MVGEQDLIALLHRADWRRLCLSGEVRGEQGVTLLLAPGKRYREELPGERQVCGCDGERIWRWAADEPSGPRARLIGGPQPPFPLLLAPSWLLDRYELTIAGDTTACGRAAIRVEATPRRSLPDGPGPRGLSYGVLPVSPRRASLSFRYDHVSAIVDAELGILLSCERRRGDDAPELTEFVSLTIDPDTDPAAFTAPPGSVTSAPTGEESFGREAAKTAAGLAAGGLGAVVRYAPFGRRHVDPFAHATNEDDPEPEMPLDDPVPGPSVAPASPTAPVSDQVLHLLYRTGEAVPELTCMLHQWVDASALLSAVPESARRTGFGGVGFLLDAMVESGRSAGTTVTHDVRSVRMDGWDKYRIDRVSPAPEPDRPGESGPDGRPGWRRRRRRDLLTVACDGDQRWEVYADRVYHGPAGPPRDELTDLLDGSWLLTCDLSGEEEITVRGRRAYRFAAARDFWPGPFGALAKLTFPLVAVVDAETGLLVRLTTYKGGKPVVRHELRDVEPGGGSGDFGFHVPAGLTVVEESEEDPPPQREWDLGVSAVDAAKKAARGLFDSFRAGRPPG